MRDNKIAKSRRKFVGSMCAGLGLASLPTITGAEELNNKKETDSKYEYKLENGELVLSEKKVQAGASSSDQRTGNNQVSNPPEGAVTVSSNDLKKSVSEINTLHEQGLVDFSKKNGSVTVSVTEKFRSKHNLTGGDFSTLHHGETGYEMKSDWWGANHYFEMNDAQTNKAIEMAIAGSAASAIGAYIATTTGAGSLAAPVLTLLAGLLGGAAGYLSNANNGHGVVIKVHHVYAGPGYAEVDGQFENDNGWPL